MKFAKLIFTISNLCLLVACATPTTSDSTDTSVRSHRPRTSEEEATSEVISSEEKESSSKTSSSEQKSSSKETTSSEQKTSSETKTSSSKSQSSIDETEETMLPIGNRTVSAPGNKDSKDDLTNWVDYEFDGSLPTNWSFISGNNKVSNAPFYADGSVKFAHLYYGLQTPMFNSWEKLEIRFHVSQVNNSSDSKKADQPIFHIYGYDESGKFISTDYLEQGSITTATAGNYTRVYVCNPNIAYLEFRLNANPYKGSQCYNFGLNKISMKGWPYSS